MLGDRARALSMLCAVPRGPFTGVGGRKGDRLQ